MKKGTCLIKTRNRSVVVKRKGYVFDKNKEPGMGDRWTRYDLGYSPEKVRNRLIDGPIIYLFYSSMSSNQT